MSALAAQALVVGYGGTPLLPPLDLEVMEGEIWAILGPNGAGKSTLMQTLLGLIPPVSGRYLQPAHVRNSYLPQGRYRTGRMPMTTRDFLQLQCDRNHSWRRPFLRRDVRERIEAISAEFALEGLLDHPLEKLSGGEYQRAALAGALVAAPDCLFLDEPTSALDRRGEAAVMRLLAEYARRHRTTVVMITHFLTSARAFASNLLLLNRHAGQVIAGSTESVWPAAEAMFAEEGAL
ncbi:MAG: ATP-binding cassette domain-containing protein [Candidatus Dadabacteria bacterium]|nr:MAG: ATP-binding cassette domain-containing protein [Candidatus Dadabacteria bacterium]